MLTCSLTQLISSLNTSFLQVTCSLYQFYASTLNQSAVIAQQIREGKKGVWVNFHIEQHLFSLLHSQYACKALPINEVAIQRSDAEMGSLFGIPELVGLLNNDQGKGLKLKIPFLSDISVGIPLPFSPMQYSFLLGVAQKRGYLAVLPDLLSTVCYASESSDVRCTLDYWVIEGEGKQCTLESHMTMKNVVVQRLAGQGLNDESETGFGMTVVVAKKVLTKKLKRTLTTKYCLNESGANERESASRLECAVNKMMTTFEEASTVYVDGVPFHGVVFMTVNNHYFSRRKSFPVCIPFVESV